jgi:hypothetical protein
MFQYPIYKAIKARLGNTVPVFFYIGQYTKGKDNTSYKVPAIYIEMPKPTEIQFLSRKLVLAKGAVVKVHYISHAPFKSHDNTIQDSAIQAHENKVKEIDKLLNGWNATDANNKLLTEQLIPVNANMLNFSGENVASVIGYKTDMYSRHLQS